MSTEPLSLDPYALEARWQANKRELGRIAAMPGLDREMHAVDAERIEAEQDAIEHALAFDCPADAASRKWSGLLSSAARITA
ncbi:MAG TPA: hypothetical protein VG055_33835 [Planctomycetaceae bacterium]|jgi:hypothetical protein|nr:hypothetical protein [Planctomycetaceae bacterium]